MTYTKFQACFAYKPRTNQLLYFDPLPDSYPAGSRVVTVKSILQFIADFHFHPSTLAVVFVPKSTYNEQTDADSSGFLCLLYADQFARYGSTSKVDDLNMGHLRLLVRLMLEAIQAGTPTYYSKLMQHERATAYEPLAKQLASLESKAGVEVNHNRKLA